jgi:hypothetical protein
MGTPLAFDFKDPLCAARFPAHGWAVNSQGIKLLWLPMRCLWSMRTVARLREHRRATSPLAKSTESWLTILNVIDRLRVVLRELHFCCRTNAQTETEISRFSREAMTEHIRTFELVPLYVELAYIYLKRSADALARGICVLAFDRCYEVPNASPFNDLRQFLHKSAKVTKAVPIIDADRLRQIFDQNTAWFDTLTQEPNPQLLKPKGIRHVLEHRPVRLIPGLAQHGNDTPYWTCLLHSIAPDAPKNLDMLKHLPELMADYCSFLAEVYKTIGEGDSYVPDSPLHHGYDDDTTGYWPPI